MVHTDQILVAAVDGQVAQGDGHSPDHLVRVGAQQLHQDGKTFLLAHRSSNIVGPLKDRRAIVSLRFIYNSKHWGRLRQHMLPAASSLTFM